MDRMRSSGAIDFQRESAAGLAGGAAAVDDFLGAHVAAPVTYSSDARTEWLGAHR